MNLTKKQNARERFVNRICEAEKQLSEQKCEEISFALDTDYLDFLQPGFLADDEAASLHFKNGILVLVVIGSNGEAKERAVTDLSPGIQMALNEPLEMMRKHCDQKLAIDCDADATMSSREAAPKRKPKEPSNITKIKRYLETISPSRSRRSTKRREKPKSDLETKADAFIAHLTLWLARLSPVEASAPVCRQRVQALCSDFLAVGDIATIHYRRGDLFLVVTNEIDPGNSRSHLVSTLSPRMRVIVALTLPSLISQYDREAGRNARRYMASVAVAIDLMIL